MKQHRKCNLKQLTPIPNQPAVHKQFFSPQADVNIQQNRPSLRQRYSLSTNNPYSINIIDQNCKNGNQFGQQNKYQTSRLPRISRNYKEKRDFEYKGKQNTNGRVKDNGKHRQEMLRLTLYHKYQKILQQYKFNIKMSEIKYPFKNIQIPQHPIEQAEQKMPTHPNPNTKPLGLPQPESRLQNPYCQPITHMQKQINLLQNINEDIFAIQKFVSSQELQGQRKQRQLQQNYNQSTQQNNYQPDKQYRHAIKRFKKKIQEGVQDIQFDILKYNNNQNASCQNKKLRKGGNQQNFQQKLVKRCKFSKLPQQTHSTTHIPQNLLTLLHQSQKYSDFSLRKSSRDRPEPQTLLHPHHPHSHSHCQDMQHHKFLSTINRYRVKQIFKIKIENGSKNKNKNAKDFGDLSTIAGSLPDIL